MMIFLICDQLMRHPLIELLYLSNLFQMPNNQRMVDIEFFGSFLCSCKRISFDDALTWYLSTSNGRPLRPSSSRLSSPLQSFLSHYCTVRSLAVLGQMRGSYCKLSLLLYYPFWTGIRKPINAHFKSWTNLASFVVFTWLLANQLPLLQASWQLFTRKMLPQSAGGRKCFSRVPQIPKHRFLCYRNKQIYFSLAEMCCL